MIDFDNPTYRERTAVHEAAHAIVAELCSVHPRVERAWLLDEIEGGGRCQMARVKEVVEDPNVDFPDLLTQAISVALAGLIAEEIALGGLGYKLDFSKPGRDEASAIELGVKLFKYLVATER